MHFYMKEQKCVLDNFCSPSNIVNFLFFFLSLIICPDTNMYYYFFFYKSCPKKFHIFFFSKLRIHELHKTWIFIWKNKNVLWTISVCLQTESISSVFFWILLYAHISTCIIIIIIIFYKSCPKKFHIFFFFFKIIVQTTFSLFFQYIKHALTP